MRPVIPPGEPRYVLDVRYHDNPGNIDSRVITIRNRERALAVARRVAKWALSRSVSVDMFSNGTVNRRIYVAGEAYMPPKGLWEVMPFRDVDILDTHMGLAYEFKPSTGKTYFQAGVRIHRQITDYLRDDR